MTQVQEFRGVATTIRKDGVWTVGRYHNTDVAMFAPRIDGVIEVILDTGGWATATTKTRMNQFANQFNLDYHVFSENFDWFVRVGETVYPFNSGRIRFGVRR